MKAILDPRHFTLRWLWSVGPRKGRIRWVLRWWLADRFHPLKREAGPESDHEP